ncbi:DinB family protein [candidate division KSB1 bacterium]|nr:DinB family protein [candidate division KSB1 bacterium]
MLAVLLRRFQHLESTRSALQQRLAQSSVEQLRFRVAPQTWSIGEIVHHLILAESLSVAYLGKKLDQVTTLRKASWSAGLRSTLMTWALRAPLKFKAPSPLILPTPEVALSDLQVQWETQRHKLHELLERVTPEMLQLSLYRHPIGGLLTVQQMLIFMQAHFEHHVRQIEKIIRHAARPQSHAERVAS